MISGSWSVKHGRHARVAPSRRGKGRGSNLGSASACVRAHTWWNGSMLRLRAELLQLQLVRVISIAIAAGPRARGPRVI